MFRKLRNERRALLVKSFRISKISVSPSRKRDAPMKICQVRHGSHETHLWKFVKCVIVRWRLKNHADFEINRQWVIGLFL